MNTALKRARHALFTSMLGAIAIAACSFSQAQVTGLGSPALDRYVQQKMDQLRAPGLSAVVVKNDRVIWSAGYGFADLATNRLVTPDTPFTQASISKTVTATAVMQLWEQGKLGLDDDVNAYLPFSIRNPHFPNAPITFRMLLSHSSSIMEHQDVIPQSFGSDCPVSLEEFLQSYLVPGGSLYGPETSYFSFAPGAQFAYVSIGYGLLAFAVERITGQSFNQYCEDHIFSPLGMVDTSFRMADFPAFSVAPAVPYVYDLKTQSSIISGFPGWAIYPASTWTVSADQMGKWLVAVMNEGAYNGTHILQPATMAMMQTPIFQLRSHGAKVDFGLAYAMIEGSGQEHDLLIGSNGLFEGVLSIMLYRPGQRVGVAIVANSSWAQMPDVAGRENIPEGWERSEYYMLLHRLLDEAAAAP